MTRSKCGLLLLLAAGASACGGDPTGSFKEAGKKISADPTVLFLNQGASSFVVAQLVDDQGNQLTTSFELGNVGPQIAVIKDSTYLNTTNGSTLKTSERFVVTGVAPGASSFELTSDGVTDTVAVNVVPTGIAATFSNASPAINEPVTFTLPAGYTFSADAGVETALGAGFVQSIAADGTSLVATIPPGSVGPVTLSGVSAGFLPGLPLSLPTADSVSASATGLPGTDAPGTAPEIAVPAEGATNNIFDVGTFTGADITGDGGVGAQYYKFTVADSGSYTFTTSWPTGPDIDAIICFDTGCSDGVSAGATAANPEGATVSLSAGTYYYSAVLFAGSPPPFFSLSLTHEVPVTTGE